MCRIVTTRCIVFMVLVRPCLQFTHKDEGAETNTMPMKTWKHIRDKPKLNCSSVVLKTLGGGVVEHDGVAEVTYQVGDKRITAELYVTREKCVPILGLEVSVDLGLVQPRDNLVTSQGGRVQHIDAVKATEPAVTMDTLENEYKDVFSGLGCYPGKYHIELNPGAQPVIDPPRLVPQALYKPLREKLKKLEAQGVIIAVNEPTDWMNGLVITEKRDVSLRLGLDPKYMNKNIRREHFQIPTFTEISMQLRVHDYSPLSARRTRTGRWSWTKTAHCYAASTPHSGDIVLFECHSESPVLAKCCRSGRIKSLETYLMFT